MVGLIIGLSAVLLVAFTTHILIRLYKTHEALEASKTLIESQEDIINLQETRIILMEAALDIMIKTVEEKGMEVVFTWDEDSVDER